MTVGFLTPEYMHLIGNHPALSELNYDVWGAETRSRVDLLDLHADRVCEPYAPEEPTSSRR
jgi:hypothetical protein